MADLEVTIGANIDELKRALDAAGKSIEDIDKKRRSGGQGTKPKEKSFEQKVIDFSKQDFNSTVGIAGMIAGPIGMAVATIATAITDLVKKAFDLVKRYADEARELNNMARAMNVTSDEVQRLKGISIATGVSIQSLARSFSDFKTNAGKATLEGSNITQALTRLGIKLTDVRKGTKGWEDVIIELQKAHAAGTDDITLNRFAQLALGDSYRELLPLIRSSYDLNVLYGSKVEKVSKDNLDALEGFSTRWDIFFVNLENSFKNTIGSILNYMQKLKDFGEKYPMLKKSSDFIMNLNPTTALARYIRDEVLTEDPELKNAAKINPGQKLSVLGYEPAQFANTLQQMGGGDIFGAVGYSPAKEIEKSTKETAEAAKQTAQNTSVIANKVSPEESPALNKYQQ